MNKLFVEYKNQVRRAVGIYFLMFVAYFFSYGIAMFMGWREPLHWNIQTFIVYTVTWIIIMPLVSSYFTVKYSK